MMASNFNRILEKYLEDDGISRDITSDLAKDLGVSVEVVYSDANELENDFFALTIINKDIKKIMINIDKIKNYDTKRFILAYQLAEFIKSGNEESYSLFEIENLNMDVYLLAQEIFKRSNMYNEFRQYKKLKKRKD